MYSTQSHRRSCGEDPAPAISSSMIAGCRFMLVGRAGRKPHELRLISDCLEEFAGSHDTGRMGGFLCEADVEYAMPTASRFASRVMLDEVVIRVSVPRRDGRIPDMSGRRPGGSSKVCVRHGDRVIECTFVFYGSNAHDLVRRGPPG